MENSFFEYRNDTGAGAVGSDSEEVIDNSMLSDESFTVHKTPGKNNTRFVPESEESASGDDDFDPDQSIPKEVAKHSGIVESLMLISSDEGSSIHSSIRRQSESSSNKLVLSSSSEEEDEASPELIPRRRPPAKQRALYGKPSNSPLIRRVKKRMLLPDTETDNSIIIENDNHKKQLCIKDTPEKLDTGDKSTDLKPKNMSNMTDDESEADDDDAGFEEEMVMSRATRMSIMGVTPKDMGSDESDFILSDESKSRCSSAIGSTNSLDNLPDACINLHQNPRKSTELHPGNTHDEPQEILEESQNDSKLSCSTFGSPAHDNDETKIIEEETDTPKKMPNKDVSIDLTKQIYMPPPVIQPFKGKLPKSTSANSSKNASVDLTINDFDSPVKDRMGVSQVKMADDDDEVTIIESKPEIIALSSDDEDETPKKSPSTKNSNSPRASKQDGAKISKAETMKQYLAPPSYPNAGVVYVKKSVRENELSKLGHLKADLQNIQYLLDTMDIKSLPDSGVRLIQRLSALEEEVRRQGDKVANMVVEPDNPTMNQMQNDGFDDQVLSWDNLQKASDQVQPRMCGKQAMSTHMAERNLILERLRDLHSSLESRPPDTAVTPPPQAMKTEMMPHQLQALSWLKWRETQKPSGGILADDMGLGKTITMIAMVAASKEANIDDEDEEDEDGWSGKENSNLVRGGTLVVCPASLLQQWAGEVVKHCKPHALSVCLHHGAQRATQPRRLATFDIVVTTYNLLQRDSEKKGVLMRMRWSRVVLDEAHIVRNHKAATSVAVMSLKASRRWCLTGTPVQNKDLDVFALLKFLRCTPFDDLMMWKKWIDNKSAGGQERLSTIMRCLLLRRTKQQLQQKGQLNCLPERELHQLEVKLTKEEMNVYQKVLVLSKTLFAQFLHQRAEKQADGQGFLPRGPRKNDPYDKMHQRMVKLQGAKPVKSHEILVLLLRLRQVCCHCGLIGAMLDREDMEEVSEDPGGMDLLSELNKLSLDEGGSSRKSRLPEHEEEEPQQAGATATEAIRSVMSPNNPVFDMSRMSSKIRAVMDCLHENVFANKGHKAVVVSQWTSVLRLVEAEIKKAGVKSCTLSGQVAVTARPPLIDALNDPNNSTKIMLLSLCAGGVGLNLCGASHLLLLDPHWNPQLEQQAQDRVYRVGQTRPVHIYRFMCVDTVEQSIRKLQDTKLELAEAVLTGAKNTNASKLTIEDLKMLFSMGPVQG